MCTIILFLFIVSNNSIEHIKVKRIMDKQNEKKFIRFLVRYDSSLLFRICDKYHWVRVYVATDNLTINLVSSVSIIFHAIDMQHHCTWFAHKTIIIFFWICCRSYHIAVAYNVQPDWPSPILMYKSEYIWNIFFRQYFILYTHFVFIVHVIWWPKMNMS